MWGHLCRCEDEHSPFLCVRIFPSFLNLWMVFLIHGAPLYLRVKGEVFDVALCSRDRRTALLLFVFCAVAFVYKVT